MLQSFTEFYQFSQGQLRNFEETRMYKDMKNQIIFTKTNYLNMDSNVLRPIEAQILSALTFSIQPKAIFEIGTYQGLTALHFAQNTPSDSTINTLDLPGDFADTAKEDILNFNYSDLLVVNLSMKSLNHRIYQNHPMRHKIKEIFENSINFDFSPYYGKIDLVFIDGNHSLPYVKSDTEAAMKMLTKNGVVVWHDYEYIFHREIFNYLNRLSKQYPIYSIP